MARYKREIIILLAPTVLFGSALILQWFPAEGGPSTDSAAKPAPSAVEGSTGSKNARLVPSAHSGQALSNVEGFDANSSLFFKMIFSVVLVLVLGAAAVYMSKKVLPRITNLPGKEIRILETAYLGPRKAVHLVRIGNQRLLIGSTNEGVTILADVTDGLRPDEYDLADLPEQQIEACVSK